MFTQITKTQVKVTIAIVLIIVGIAALVIWEGWGREKMLYSPVVVAAEEIFQGQEIIQDMLVESSVPVDLVLEGTYKGADMNLIIGQIAKQKIPAKTQITGDLFYTNDFHLKEGQSLFYCPASWFNPTNDRSFTTTIRRGDRLEFWTDNLEYKLGEYTVAFARDEGENEVINTEGIIGTDVIERTGSTGIVDHFEIISTKNEFKKLFTYVYDIDIKENVEIYTTEEVTMNDGTKTTVTLPIESAKREPVNKIFLIQKIGKIEK